MFARKASHAAPSARDVGHISLGGGRAATEEEASNTAEAEALAIAAALRAWTLCASVCASRSLAGAVRNRHLPRIAALLEHSSLDVRVAAGEAVAVVFSAVNRRRALDDPTAAAAAAKAAQRAAEAAAGGAIDTDAALAMAAAVEEDSAAVDDEAVKQMLEEDEEYEDEDGEDGSEDDGSDEENVLDENAALNKGWGGAVTYADEDLPVRDEPLKSALEELATDSAFVSLFLYAVSLSIDVFHAFSGLSCGMHIHFWGFSGHLFGHPRNIFASPTVPTRHFAPLAHHPIINHHHHSPKPTPSGDHHRAKKERASQRVVFRSVLATVADGKEPEETLRLDDAKVRTCVCLCAVYAFL